MQASRKHRWSVKETPLWLESFNVGGRTGRLTGGFQVTPEKLGLELETERRLRAEVSRLEFPNSSEHDTSENGDQKGCDGQVLLHRCCSSVSNQLGFFREWRARGRHQSVVHSVIQPCWVFHGFFCTSSLESFLKECESSKSRRVLLMVPALLSNSKPSLSKNSPSLTQRSIHLPVHPPTSPSSHRRDLLQKKGQHQLEITGTSLLTACQPQPLWRRTYSPTV
ncbi:hypothetical protein ILYODFUR_020792 [Ilyodon furcidens]|uniref:Uncharacterized protein n=1 Tax=Ilyodon furcidens TaxID=33524 RepID=A0ABV0UIW5_9TELE